MGTGEASGDKRAMLAAEAAIANPLLDEVSMKGARGPADLDHRRPRPDPLRSRRGGEPHPPGGRRGRQHHSRRDIRLEARRHHPRLGRRDRHRQSRPAAIRHRPSSASPKPPSACAPRRRPAKPKPTSQPAPGGACGRSLFRPARAAARAGPGRPGPVRRADLRAASLCAPAPQAYAPPAYAPHHGDVRVQRVQPQAYPEQAPAPVRRVEAPVQAAFIPPAAEQPLRPQRMPSIEEFPDACPGPYAPTSASRTRKPRPPKPVAAP